MMGLIVISKVLKYKAFLIALALISTLAFFQSNQALDDSSNQPKQDDNQPSQSGVPETPSIPETPDAPDTPDLPGNDENNGDSDSQTSISITIRTNFNNLDLPGGDSEETTIEEIKREITNGSISLSFDSNGADQKVREKIEDEDGETSIKFSVDSDQKTKTKVSKETEIDIHEERD